MATRITIAQLEQMKTHELADLLGNVVLLLRRLPDVEFKELVRPIPSDEPFAPLGSLPPSSDGYAFTAKGLANKKVSELKEIARSLKLPTSGNKPELVKRILAKTAGGHSEQYAIQNI